MNFRRWLLTCRSNIGELGLNTGEYHKPRNSPQLLARSLPVNEDRNAEMTQGEFLVLAWRAANDKAKEMGWIR